MNNHDLKRIIETEIDGLDKFKLSETEIKETMDRIAENKKDLVVTESDKRKNELIARELIPMLENVKKKKTFWQRVKYSLGL